MLVTGPNGAGKTNLLEALHVGTQGFSPRTRSDAQLVRFGAEAGRVRLAGARGDVSVETEVALAPSAARRATLNGARLRAAEQLRGEIQTLVFTPDRLAIVKGAPAVRRAYFDRSLGRLIPARASLAVEYSAAVVQRNAALRRVAAGLSSAEALEPWTERVAALGSELTAARREAVAALDGPFGTQAGALGLERARLRYDAEAPSVADLEARLSRDLERGTTGLGPHLEDVEILADDRDLRSFGSQGEQRLALLALLLAEAETIADRTGVAPLLLLDDVLSELDPGRRQILAARVRTVGQALVTATDAAMLPTAPDQLLEVTPGAVLEAVA